MQRFLSPFVLIYIVLCSVVCGEDAAPKSEWTLPEEQFPALKSLLDIALSQSPRMLARSTEEAIAEANRISARAAQLPSLSGYYNYYPWYRDQREGENVVRYSERNTYAFTISQPLYHWNALRNSTRIAELHQQISTTQTANTYRILVNEVRSQYLQLAVKKALLRRARFAQQQAEAALALANEKLERNIFSSSDMFHPRLNVEQAALATDRAQEDYDMSRSLLGKLCGTSPIADSDVPEIVPELTATQDELAVLTTIVDDGPDQRPFPLRIIDDQIEIESRSYEIAKVRLRPKLGLILGASQDQQSYTANIGQRYGVASFYAGVGISWTIFDGFASKGSKMASQARRRQLERTRKELSENLIDEARSKLRLLQFSARNLAISERLFNATKSGVARSKENIDRGLGTEDDLRAAEYRLAQAHVETYSARIDYMMKLCDLLSFLQLDPALENLPENRR